MVSALSSRAVTSAKSGALLSSGALSSLGAAVKSSGAALPTTVGASIGASALLIELTSLFKDRTPSLSVEVILSSYLFYVLLT